MLRTALHKFDNGNQRFPISLIPQSPPGGGDDQSAGFFDRELHLYLNKETLILSCIGIVPGIPAGMGISRCLGLMLQIPGAYFAVSIHHVSYLICAVIALAFTLIVNQITKPMLNEIDPVEALKSVE